MIASPTSSPRHLWRRGINWLGTGLAGLAVVIALLPLGAMLAYVLLQGGTSLNPAFFTHLPQPTGETGGGMVNAILGTILLIGLASLIGLPLGIGSGIYLSHARGPFAGTVRFVTDVIAGTPSIVAGIVAYALVVVPTGHYSGWAGAVALALLMFPTVGRATEEVIRLVPHPVREAALALGLPEWKTMLRIVLPTAASGIITAVMLGIARVAGETAPLLFTVLGNNQLALSPNGEVSALPLQIWQYAQTPYDDLHRQAWEGALVLFLLILILNLVARYFASRVRVRATGTT